MIAPDGGPAFPVQSEMLRGDAMVKCTVAEGMTLRQWYKGQALAGLLANQSLLVRVDKEMGAKVSTRDAAAKFAGAVADSILAEDAAFAERAKGGAK